MSVKRSSKIIRQIFSLYSVCCVLGLVYSAQGSTSITAGVLPTQAPTGPVVQSSVATPVRNSSVSVLVSSSPFPSATMSEIVIVSPTQTQTSTSKTPKPTTRTTRTTSPATEESGRKFDGLSFFGGMLLGAAICVILLVAIKYYRAKKRSYHSL